MYKMIVAKRDSRKDKLQKHIASIIAPRLIISTTNMNECAKNRWKLASLYKHSTFYAVSKYKCKSSVSSISQFQNKQIRPHNQKLFDNIHWFKPKLRICSYIASLILKLLNQLNLFIFHVGLYMITINIRKHENLYPSTHFNLFSPKDDTQKI